MVLLSEIRCAPAAASASVLVFGNPQGQMTTPQTSASERELAEDRSQVPEFVSIVMPALNEERYIERAIGSVLPDPSEFDCELLVMDGGSTDATVEIVARLSAGDSRIRLVHNPRKLQSAALNLAAREADSRASYLVRADCHATYPKGFVRNLMHTITQTKAASVVVSMNTLGRSCTQKGIAAAQNSRLGNGGSAHRNAGSKGFVDHGHHAAFNRDAFLRAGGYDETCPYNEDAEFDWRLIASGGKIYLNGDIVIDYYPRDTFTKLARQYANHGWGRANTILRHGGLPKLRQALPVVVLLACLGGVAAGLAVHPLFAAIPGAYVTAVCAAGIALSLKQRSACAALSGPAAVVMHLSWACGFLKRICQAPFQRHKAPRRATRDAVPERASS